MDARRLKPFEMDLIAKSNAHFEAVRDKRIDHILAFYVETDELQVFVEGPRWVTLGYENVARGWRDFCASPISVVGCSWVEALRSKVVGSMGLVGGIVDLTVLINGVESTIRFRGSFVFEEVVPGDWRVVHEHFSQPAADPYGIGDWLKPQNDAIP